MINIGYEGLEMGKNHTLQYLITTQYKVMPVDSENTSRENVIHNISTTVYESEVENGTSNTNKQQNDFPRRRYTCQEIYIATCWDLKILLKRN